MVNAVTVEGQANLKPRTCRKSRGPDPFRAHVMDNISKALRHKHMPNVNDYSLPRRTIDLDLTNRRNRR